MRGRLMIAFAMGTIAAWLFVLTGYQIKANLLLAIISGLAAANFMVACMSFAQDDGRNYSERKVQAMRNEENLLGRLDRAEFGTADERAVRELLEDRALTKGLLEIIQQSLVDQHWQTLGDLYRGKTLFLSQDLLNRIDTALEVKGE